MRSKNWVRRRMTEAFRKRMVVIRQGEQEPFIDVLATGIDACDDEDSPHG